MQFESSMPPWFFPYLPGMYHSSARFAWASGLRSSLTICYQLPTRMINLWKICSAVTVVSVCVLTTLSCIICPLLWWSYTCITLDLCRTCKLIHRQQCAKYQTCFRGLSAFSSDKYWLKLFFEVTELESNVRINWAMLSYLRGFMDGNYTVEINNDNTLWFVLAFTLIFLHNCMFPTF